MRTKRPQRTILVNEEKIEDWKFHYTGDPNYKATWGQTLAYIDVYLKRGKERRIKKFWVLFKKLITFSLKPTQDSSEKP